MRHTNLIPPLALLALGLVACGPRIQVVKSYSLHPSAGATNKVEKGGLSIDITPITPKDCGHDPELNVSGFVILSSPAFRLRIKNSNEHVVRLTGSVLKLADKDGTLYDIIGRQGLAEKVAGATQDYLDENPRILGVKVDVPKLQSMLRSKVSDLKLVEADTTILPGFSGTYYLVFDLPKKTQEKNFEWTKNSAPFRVLLFDIVTQTGDAGQTTRKTKFEFSFDSRQSTDTYHDGKLVSSTPM